MSYTIVTANKQKFEADLERLIDLGVGLYINMRLECADPLLKQDLEIEQGMPLEVVEEFMSQSREYSFQEKYQEWYSEAHAVVRQVLPDRLKDFESYYESPHKRQFPSSHNYVIKDYLHGEAITNRSGQNAAIPRFHQQLNIVKAAKSALSSSLVSMTHMLQADFFDSELEGAQNLANNGHLRAAGVICGVVIEKHLIQVCNGHDVPIDSKKVSIYKLAQALYSAKVIEHTRVKLLEHLAAIRNVCAHGKEQEPEEWAVRDLISGTSQVIKKIF